MSKATCPNCGSNGEEVGSLCPNSVCSNLKYHLIPTESFEKHQISLLKGNRQPDPEIGKLIDRYLLIEKIGEGGMGTVYLALQMPLKRKVALKMIGGIILNDTLKKRFEREATALSTLYHPNIVSLIDFGFNPATGSPFMVLEYVKGGRELSFEMQKKKNSGEKWKSEEILNIFSQILNALSVAHQSGLIHRDIKPQNIMILEVEGNPNMVKILDFGLVRAAFTENGESKLTIPGTLLGTPQYMAPEQIKGMTNIDHRCDLYAVGAILFEVLTQKPLCGTGTVQEIITTKLDPDFNPFKSIEKGLISPRLEAFLKKAIAWDPNKRFSTALEMKSHLTDILKEHGKNFAPSENSYLIEYAPTIQMKTSEAGSNFSQSLEKSEKATPKNTFDELQTFTLKKKTLLKTGVILFSLAGALTVFYFVWSYIKTRGNNTKHFNVNENNPQLHPQLIYDGFTDLIEVSYDTVTSLIQDSNQKVSIEKEKHPDRKKEIKKAENEEANFEESIDATTDIISVTDETQIQNEINKISEEEAFEESELLPEKPSGMEIKEATLKLKILLISKCLPEAGDNMVIQTTIVFSGKDGSAKKKGGIVVPDAVKDCVNDCISQIKISPFKMETFPVEFHFSNKENDNPKWQKWQNKKNINILH